MEEKMRRGLEEGRKIDQKKEEYSIRYKIRYNSIIIIYTTRQDQLKCQ